MRARKPTARPCAIRINGDAFTSSSLQPLALLSGSMKNTWNDCTGDLPSAQNSSEPASKVRPTAISGASQRIVRDGCGRGSSRYMVGSFCRRLREAGHLQADALGVGIGGGHRLG